MFWRGEILHWMSKQRKVPTPETLIMCKSRRDASDRYAVQIIQGMICVSGTQFDAV